MLLLQLLSPSQVPVEVKPRPIAPLPLPGVGKLASETLLTQDAASSCIQAEFAFDLAFVGVSSLAEFKTLQPWSQQ